MAKLPPRPEPLGFGNCGRCAYRLTGDVVTCFDCAWSTLDALGDDTCSLCEGALNEDRTCGNPLCNRTEDQRGWRWVYAMSTRTGALKRAISAYKYDDKTGWAYIFGRVIVGYLEAIPSFSHDYGLIIPMPTYVGSGGRSWDHTKLVIDRAAIEGPNWPFRTDVMTKNAATPRMVDLNFRQRALSAEEQLRPALEVVDADAVTGRRVLVFDDVFTGGLTLREVAYKLKAEGATEVSGLVLARQPFRPRRA